ncbi:TPA: phage baseplate assembly protein V [Pseudomonas aeruginosa 059A]|nr:phage baseplate assembly protein V [Pseudomonas aeruginosa 059A]HCL2955112.1 phage baseplate assembly protein V [Pseudomonas aeruginosa 059A]HCL2967560.1 phage baseplate assembly protein V [Pseudomonas aeruginosa 059A]HCL2973721.1 phage baseplate assembly protein V [Pseudomonas aeruginosa 059A]HCL2986526.1 phage baseplate assembly protein V [Pseudomonas aeruginosa 059A]
MNQIAELARLIENLVRLGTIADVDVAKARVRVKSGDITTAWLPWMALRAGTSKEWDPPTEGEQVLLFSPSGQLTQGVALVGLFSEANPANGNLANLHRRTYPDGAVIEYDSAAKHLRATLPGTAEVIAAGDISLNSGGNIQITAAGNIAITGARVDIN